MLSENMRDKWMHNLENHFSLEFTPKCVQGDKELVLYAVKIDGMNLAFASDELKDDIDVVSIAIENNINAFQFASKRLQDRIIKSGIGSVKSMPCDDSDLSPLLECIYMDGFDELIDSIMIGDTEKRNAILSENLMSLIDEQIEIAEKIRRIQSMMLADGSSNLEDEKEKQKTK